MCPSKSPQSDIVAPTPCLAQGGPDHPDTLLYANFWRHFPCLAQACARHWFCAPNRIILISYAIVTHSKLCKLVSGLITNVLSQCRHILEPEKIKSSIGRTKCISLRFRNSKLPETLQRVGTIFYCNYSLLNL